MRLLCFSANKQLTGDAQIARHPGIRYETVGQVSEHDTGQWIHHPIENGRYGPKNDQQGVPAIRELKLVSQERKDNVSCVFCGIVDE